MSEPTLIWLDCDPGHDDLIAIMLAVRAPGIELLGISTTHGNATAHHTASSAARCLSAFGASEHIKVYCGAPKSLLHPSKQDSHFSHKVHGADGLGGVQGLPDASDSKVIDRIATGDDGQPLYALEGMISHIRRAEQPITIVATGPLTNIALFVSAYPCALQAKVSQIVFMGGGIGVRNRGPVAKYNVSCDPHAAQIVMDAPIPVVMIPLNVTHTAIVNSAVDSRIHGIIAPMADAISSVESTSSILGIVSTALKFFADSYKSTLGFDEGPPLHDTLTISYVSNPSLFTGKCYHVDVLTGEHSFR
ncbi:uridine nucleosidase [Flagelloscypha sp. PMI_526]|nr:uridine nucleosidase [Flagelloscypha sp. PMI_526]